MKIGSKKRGEPDDDLPVAAHMDWAKTTARWCASSAGPRGTERERVDRRRGVVFAKVTHTGTQHADEKTETEGTA